MAIVVDHESEYKGEQKVRDAIADYFSDEVVVYNNREVNGREYDICLLVKNVCVFIIEVKGWLADKIKVHGIDDIEVEGYEERQKSPKKQAKSYCIQYLTKLKKRFGTTVLDANNQIAGQAVLNPLVCNPTMIFMAAALANIDKKLDAIQELQQEMMDFLVQKEKAELKGNLTFLADILNSFKYNWNSDMYKQSNHVKVLDIRQAAEQKILFYRQRIIEKTKKKNLIHIDQDVKKQTAKLLDLFKDYRLALYTHGFAYFLEVMLLGNFDADYLKSIEGKIEEYSIQYRELYTAVYDQMENYSKSSVQSAVLKGLKTVSKATGEAIAKTPVISKGKVDEALIGAGSKLGQLDSRRMMDTMKVLIDAKDSCVRPFVDNIEMVNQLYNKPINVLLDGKNIYLGVA